MTEMPARKHSSRMPHSCASWLRSEYRFAHSRKSIPRSPSPLVCGSANSSRTYAWFQARFVSGSSPSSSLFTPAPNAWIVPAARMRCSAAKPL
eukprot:CAMPEP_0181211886 /NCGR_PEP_ID=MMETSP1096-20121128/24039_1 /TAXON_ID=156174 ORGANISM="Chrysochromulina ericina, Strain CCMP281" /NCGR_SAMPLE_ID=MMETSP1096 /ASSEMBLY_ACC=CAM_ASM_000453 /LENGTH=92 /DNA_ID=CAMNT_0023303345 /DNA_START=964 /DNA_END=1239 /DNA_ORIENTATION=-